MTQLALNPIPKARLTFKNNDPAPSDVMLIGVRPSALVSVKESVVIGDSERYTVACVIGSGNVPVVVN
jgi:hypothetical protein